MAGGTGRGDTPPEITDMVARLKSSLGNAKTYVQTLRDKVKTNMTQAEVDVVVSGIDEVVQGLDSISADPVNPTPPVFGKKK